MFRVSQEQVDRFEKILSKQLKDFESGFFSECVAIHSSDVDISQYREYNRLLRMSQAVKKWRSLMSELQDLDVLIEGQDIEMSSMARGDKFDVLRSVKSLEINLEEFFHSGSNNLVSGNIILELRAATGGQESSLFVQDMAKMYLDFATRCGFACETTYLRESDMGGIKEVVFFIESSKKSDIASPFSLFQFEKGVHRVQRVPKTESNDRIHTSTVTVAILQEVAEVDVKIDHNDLKIDTFRASGNGGQHLQKTDSAVRITYMPLRIVVQCQDDRSQTRNKEKAMKLLRAKIMDIRNQTQQDMIAKDRKSQFGSGKRAEKVRTYNFPQDRITDHRASLTFYDIENILSGNLMSMIQKIQSALLFKDQE